MVNGVASVRNVEDTDGVMVGEEEVKRNGERLRTVGEEWSGSEVK